MKELAFELAEAVRQLEARRFDLASDILLALDVWGKDTAKTRLARIVLSAEMDLRAGRAGVHALAMARDAVAIAKDLASREA